MESCPIKRNKNQTHKTKRNRETAPNTNRHPRQTQEGASLLVRQTWPCRVFSFESGKWEEMYYGEVRASPGHGSGRASLSLIVTRGSSDGYSCYRRPSRSCRKEKRAFMKKPGRGSGNLAIGHPTQRSNVSRNRFCMARSCCKASAGSLVIPTACTVSAVSRASSWVFPLCNKSWYTVAAIIAQ